MFLFFSVVMLRKRRIYDKGIQKSWGVLLAGLIFQDYNEENWFVVLFSDTMPQKYKEEVSGVNDPCIDTVHPMEEQTRITLIPQLTPVINYALQQNRLPILPQVTIQNHTDAALSGITLTVESTPAILLPFTQQIEQIPPQSEYTLQGINVQADPAYLAGLTERVEGRILLRLSDATGTLAEYSTDATALAFDEWHGTAFYPELICAFITPNHPEVIKLAARAAEYLGQWSDSPSLDAYQRKNPNRVRMQAAAVYAALQEQNIVYSVPPASFEAIGQRVRLCDAVMQQKMGTCLDLTLLYASVLETMGLHPLLILQPGHIFAGVWLEDQTFPEAVQDDPSLLTKRLADGIGEVAVVECTALTAGKTLDFDAACSIAQRELAEPVDYIVDVARARLSGIRPLPQRLPTAEGWQIETPPRDAPDITGAPEELAEQVKVQEADAPAPMGRIAQWERKLLDLGLRNPLIHLRITRRVIPILADSLSRLEDALSDGEEYGIAPRPAEWEQQQIDCRDPERFADLGAYKALILSEFENHRLRSALSAAELSTAITGLYRAARTSLEENGANTLYLALGLLRWYETRASERPRYAPILLLPVDIVRKSASKGYVIRLRDEDPQLNITLLEMLKQDFGITIGGLDPLPQDEHGVALRTVYTTLRRAVMDQPRWDVIETAFLGIFSFTQFVMWNDLRNRVEDLQRNKIVRSLVEGKLAWTPSPMQPNAPVDENGALLPLPADASQLYAIEQAAEGQSFVLHGPPGTGKSQTITALIANALAQGKTVLFVAEKMAALSVVQSRLEKIGIGPFCLQLHSNKSKKRDVLDQLKAASEVVHGQPRESWQKQAEETARLRQQLDAYAQALHQQRACGASLFELVNLYEDCKGAPSVVQLPADFAEQATKDSLREQEHLLGQLTAACKEAGNPAEHPLRWMTRTEYRLSLRADLAAALEPFIAALEKLTRTGTAFSDVIGREPKNAADWQCLQQTAAVLLDWKTLPWSHLPETAWQEERLSELEQYAAHRDTAQKLKQQLAERWQESFLQQDAATWKNAWTQASLQWFLSRWFAQNRVCKLLAPYARGAVQRDALQTDLDALARWQQEQAAADALQVKVQPLLQPLTPEQAVPASLLALAQQTRGLYTRLREMGTEITVALLREKGESLLPLCQELTEAVSQKEAAWQVLEPLLCPSAEFAGQTPPELLTGSRQMAEHLDAVKDWCVWNQACEAARQAGMEPLAAAMRSGLAPEQAAPVWHRAVFVALIQFVVESEPALRQFRGSVFNETIRQFKELDAHLTDLARTEIYCRLAAQVPDFTQAAANSSEVGILQRAIRSGGRGISIRSLFEQIPALLPKLCPCMLMSPLSVAQYLDPHRAPFDLVVFDEASQLPTCKAVGVLARGENAVIVGDPKQMPPTSFFTGNTVDEENLEHEDLESILDDCLALNMPQSHLLWHYRSRHESLIAFSNREFYDNKLYTFPSADDQQRKVRLVPIEGCFDRGKTRQNPAEARAIVEELTRRAHDPQQMGYSVGVVTFNVQQQTLISDLLDEACKADPTLEAWAFDAAEPLFIKNLENVQGDERDVILFSIGYGPDTQGKVTMNFGPLNREGGWRRLNVAVSRARWEMVVFSTLQPEQINLSRTSAKGVAALKDFLSYAANGNLQETAVSAAEHTEVHGIMQDICDALTREGWQTHCLVGHSQYRLDIGVADPAHPGQYLLGILLDGSSYRDARTTRDRELAQEGILKGLGWNLHRIWTMDWLESRQKELTRLLEHLQELKTAPPTAQPVPAEPPVKLAAPPDLVATPKDESQQPAVYHAARLPVFPLDADSFLEPSNQKRIQQALTDTLAQEAPIREALLIRRVTQSFGITRAGSRIQRYLVQLLSAFDVSITLQQGERFYWTSRQDPEQYTEYRVAGDDEDKRDARDLPEQEIANAAAAVLHSQVGLPKEDLVRETARLLGYTRLGTSVRPAMEAGIDYGTQKGLLCQSQPEYYVLKSM